jgi:hypothetical protein
MMALMWRFHVVEEVLSNPVPEGLVSEQQHMRWVGLPREGQVQQWEWEVGVVDGNLDKNRSVVAVIVAVAVAGSNNMHNIGDNILQPQRRYQEPKLIKCHNAYSTLSYTYSGRWSLSMLLLVIIICRCCQRNGIRSLYLFHNSLAPVGSATLLGHNNKKETRQTKMRVQICTGTRDCC